jgi:hypothetical protein
VGARILGVVMNEVNPTSRKYGYYYNRYYSKYSYQYQKPAAAQKKSRKTDKPLLPEPEKLSQPEVFGAFPVEPDQILPPVKLRRS